MAVAPRHESNHLSPEEQFMSLLPRLMENIEPQIGYKLELMGVPLAKTFGRAATKSLEATLGTTLQDTADLLYTYQPITETIDPTALRLPLRHRITSVERAKDVTGNEVLADCIYLQRWEGGYIQTYGLGGDTMVPIGEGPREVPAQDVNRFLASAGLNSLHKNRWSHTRISDWLGRSADWAAREQTLIPLPADEDGACNQIIISRRRSVQTYPGEPAVHADDYEVTFARISSPYSPNVSVGDKEIDEETLRATENDATGRTLTMVDTRYSRYDHPFQPGLLEIYNETVATRQPEADDYRYFLQVLGAFASNAS